MKTLTNIRPVVTCDGGCCPRIYYADQGVVVVGEKLSELEVASIADNIGEGEVAVLLPHGLIPMGPDS